MMEGVGRQRELGSAVGADLAGWEEKEEGPISDGFS
jgi:hypothetical protein